MFEEAGKRAAQETRKLIREPDVLGKVVILVLAGGLAGWFAAKPLFAIPEASYTYTVGASLAVCGMSVVLLCVAIRNLQLIWRGYDPLRMKVPPEFNELLVLIVAIVIGVTVSLSVFR